MRHEIVTFGCRLNLVESEAIRALALAAGLGEAAIVNTCAVTAEAERQAGQAIRKLKRAAPERPVIVTGCAAQIAPERFSAMPEVARVLGNAEKLAPATWATLAHSNSLRLVHQSGDRPGESTSVHQFEGRSEVGDIMAAGMPALPRLGRFADHTRAFVQIQNGCDHRCSFCVIPFGRGRSRSLPPAEAVAQVRAASEAGALEVVLTGVDLTSYGADLGAEFSLGRLVRTILRAVPDLPRLRLSSIDAAEADADLRSAFAEEARLMPHLHLSLQSGDDLILKRMKRRHFRRDAVRLCTEMRDLRPDIAFGADLIAGFPTEDEAMFSRSLDLVAECDLAYLHVFPFSPRPGTPAARMPQVAGPLAKERAGRLRALAAERLARHLDARVGKPLRILTERGNTGRAEDFSLVRFEHDVAAGEIVAVRPTGADGRALLAA